MNRNISRTNRNYIIIGLCMILVIMGVGYAAFSSQLKISGTSTISSNFLIKITSIKISNVIGGATNKEDITTYNDTSATFGVGLQAPGDSITYDITIENQGNIDAVLKTINKMGTNNSAILFEIRGVNEGKELLHGKTETMTVKVTYNPNITSQPEALSSTLKISLDYVQKEKDMGSLDEEKIILGGKEVEVVTNGDGLYKDEYEEGRYIYKGADPNNHIIFSGDDWRIMSVENDGTIKLIKNKIIDNMAWDSTNINDWDRPAELNTYLNEIYLKTLSDSDKIVSHNWNIGEVTPNNGDLAKQVVDEGSSVWSGKVGLITVSEYVRSNINVSQCDSVLLNNQNYATCKLTNYLFNIVPSDGYLWTISPFGGTSNLVLNIYGVSRPGGIGGTYTNHVYGIAPSVYILNDITLSGTGTKEDPYTIIN